MPDDFETQIKRAIQKPAIGVHTKKKGSSPPVFVKLERYKEILQDIQKLKSYTLGLRDALDAMADIEKEFKTAMNLSDKVLDKVNILISSLDMKMLQKSGPLTALTPIKPPTDIENYVKGIYEQIERLKTELQSLE